MTWIVGGKHDGDFSNHVPSYVIQLERWSANS